MNKFPLPQNNVENESTFVELEKCYEQIFANDGKVIDDKEQIKELEERINHYVFGLYSIESDEDIDLILS